MHDRPHSSQGKGCMSDPSEPGHGPGKKRGRPTREEACAKLNEEARAWSAKMKGDARLRRPCPSAQESES